MSSVTFVTFFSDDLLRTEIVDGRSDEVFDFLKMSAQGMAGTQDLAKKVCLLKKQNKTFKFQLQICKIVWQILESCLWICKFQQWFYNFYFCIAYFQYQLICDEATKNEVPSYRNENIEYGQSSPVHSDYRCHSIPMAVRCSCCH